MNKRKLVQGIGINDTEIGWCGKHYKLYDIWSYLMKNVSEGKVTVCDEWLRLSNFGEWALSQKDFSQKMKYLTYNVITPNSTHYCPDNCAFLHFTMHLLLAFQNGGNGKDLPKGVFKYKASREDGNVYYVMCNQWKRRQLIGRFKTLEEAIVGMKNFKKCKYERIINSSEIQDHQHRDKLIKGLQGYIALLDDQY